MIESFVEERDTPSAVYIFADADSILHSHSAGYSDLKTKTKADIHTVYKGFSITKTFTSLAILKLAMQNQLHLDDPVEKYLKPTSTNSASQKDIQDGSYYPFVESITIRQLMNHTSGIKNPIPVSWVHRDTEENQFSYSDFYKKIIHENQTLKTAPGKEFSYSNVGYMVLGEVIAKITKTSYVEAINKMILDPLGLEPPRQIFFYADKVDTKNQYRIATGYQKRFSFMNLVLGFFIDRTKYVEGTYQGWNALYPFYVNGPAYGGLSASPSALVRYLQILLADKDLQRNILSSDNSNPNQKFPVTNGWFTGAIGKHRFIHHAGGGAGFYCEIRIYPDLKRASVIMMNRTGISDERLLDKIDKKFLKIE